MLLLQTAPPVPVLALSPTNNQATLSDKDDAHMLSSQKYNVTHIVTPVARELPTTSSSSSSACRHTIKMKTQRNVLRQDWNRPAASLRQRHTTSLRYIVTVTLSVRGDHAKFLTFVTHNVTDDYCWLCFVGAGEQDYCCDPVVWTHNTRHDKWVSQPSNQPLNRKHDELMIEWMTGWVVSVL